MQKTLTPEKLVLFVYDEISDPHERDALAKAIRCDSELYQEYCSLQEDRLRIDQSARQVSQHTIDSLLNYSKALSVVHTKNHRTIELVMN